MKTSKNYMFALAAALGMACGDDPAQTEHDSSPATNARQKCENLIQTMCSAYAECLIDQGEILPGQRAEFAKVCHDQFTDDDAYCDDVIAVSPSYQQCITDIKRELCFDPEELPSSCESAVLS